MSRSKFIFFTHLPVFLSWLFPSATVSAVSPHCFFPIKGIPIRIPVFINFIDRFINLPWFFTFNVSVGMLTYSDFHFLYTGQYVYQLWFSLFVYRSICLPVLIFTFYISVNMFTCPDFYFLYTGQYVYQLWFSLFVYRSICLPALIFTFYVSVNMFTCPDFHFLYTGQYVYLLWFSFFVYWSICLPALIFTFCVLVNMFTCPDLRFSCIGMHLSQRFFIFYVSPYDSGVIVLTPHMLLLYSMLHHIFDIKHA